MTGLLPGDDTSLFGLSRNAVIESKAEAPAVLRLRRGLIEVITRPFMLHGISKVNMALNKAISQTRLWPKC